MRRCCGAGWLPTPRQEEIGIWASRTSVQIGAFQRFTGLREKGLCRDESGEEEIGIRRARGPGEAGTFLARASFTVSFIYALTRSASDTDRFIDRRSTLMPRQHHKIGTRPAWIQNKIMCEDRTSWKMNDPKLQKQGDECDKEG